MKLRSLELKNYRRHSRTFIEWPDGVIAVLGRNGSGKSTILESIGFALFGVPATRTGKDLLRWDGAGPMDTVSVSLEFDLGGEAIRIHRELRGKGLTPNATLTVDGKLAVDPGAGSNEAVTNDIERRLGMDRETFFTTLVAQQKDLDRLATLTPAKRKQLLLEMLGVDALDRAIEHARQERRATELKVDAIRDALPDEGRLDVKEADAKQELAQATNTHRVAAEAWARCQADLATSIKHLDAIQQQSADRDVALRTFNEAARLQDEANARLVACKERMDAASSAKQRAAELEPFAARFDSLQSAMVAARSGADAFDRRATALAELERLRVQLPNEIGPGVDAAEARLATADAQRQATSSALAVAEAKVRQIAEHRANFANLEGQAACPTCEQPLDGHVPGLLTKLGADLAAATGELEAAKTIHEKAGREWSDAQTALADARREHDARARLTERENQIPEAPVERPDIGALEKKLAAARAAHDERTGLLKLAGEHDPLAKQFDALTTDHAQRHQQLDAAKRALDLLPDVTKSLDAAKQSHANAAAAERDAERAVLGAKHAIDLANKSLESVAARRADMVAQTKRLKETEELARYWGAVASGRGKGLLEAFKAHLVGRIGPAIGREASRLLERFTSGRYTEVTLDSEYNMYVSDGGTRYALERFSGGESDLVHLAVRLAVSRMLVERNHAEMRFLALDEVFGGLDAQRRQSVLGALQELGGLYSQVVLVTHHDDLRDALDAALVVEDVDGEAKVTLHAG